MKLIRGLTLAPWVGLFGLALAPSSCRTLEPIQLDQCGNQVVEASLGEDCDGFSELGSCGNYNATNGNVVDGGQCKFICATGENPIDCPAEGGFRCGSDGVCRRPSAAFQLGPDTIDATATRVVARALGKGDDRSAELLVFDDRVLQIFSFDSDGRRVATQSVPAEGRELAVGEFTQAFDPAIALRYEASPTAIGVALYDIADDGSLKPFNVRDEKLTLASEEKSILFAAEGLNPGLEQLLMSFDAQGLRAWDGDKQAYVGVWGDSGFNKDNFGGLAVGNALDELARCAEVALAPDLETVNVFALCDDDDLNENVADEIEIKFPGPAGAVRLVPADDVSERIRRPSVFFVKEPNADDLTDVIVFATTGNGSGRAFISRQVETGPGMRNTFEPDFSLITFIGARCEGDVDDQDLTDRARPLAFADFNQDGLVDVVTEATVFLSRAETSPLRFVASVCGDFRWHSAQVADLNGNGIPDLVVQEQERLDEDNVGTALLALINNGQGAFTQYRITTEAVSDYEVADFDGDGVDDIAFALEVSLQSIETVSVSYGQGSGGPADPVTVGEFDFGISQIAAGRFRGDDGAAELVVVDAFANDIIDDKLSHRMLIGSGSGQLIAPVLFEETDTLPENTTLRHVPSLLASARLSSSFDPPDVLLALANYRFSLQSVGQPLTFPSVWTTELQFSDQPVTNYWKEKEETLDLFDDLEANDVSLGATLDLDADGIDDTDEVIVMFPDRIEVYALDILERGADVVTTGTSIEIDELAPLPDAPDPLVVDLDEDGLDDILYFSGVDGAQGVRLTLLRNRGEGTGSGTPFDVSSVYLNTTYAFSQTFSVLPPALAKLRLDADARPEMVVVGDEIGVLRVVDGALEFESRGFNPLGFPQSATGGDFNGDGVDDLALAIGGQVQILFGVDLVERTDEETLIFEAGFNDDDIAYIQ